MLSAHADVFGVGTTPVDASRLVVASGVTFGWIVPGGGITGISDVESGRSAPLVGGPPGVELHMVFDALPTGDTDGITPVVLATMGVGIVPKGMDDIVVGIITIVPSAMDVGPVLDDVGRGGIVMEGAGKAGTVGGGGAGIVVPG